MPGFAWDENKRRSAQLIAEGELSDQKIAERVGVTRQAIWLWRQEPEFMAEVDSAIERINTTLRRRAISHVERRVFALNDRWQRLHRVIEERAADPSVAIAAGGGTGLLCRTEKAVGTKVVEEFAVDVAVLKELREIEKQAAQELGQWAERVDLNASLKGYAVENDPEAL